MSNRERNSYDLKTLAHVIEQGTGAPENVPVLRSDLLDGLQRFLASQYKAHSILLSSGYYDALSEADAVLDTTPGLREFVDAMQHGCHAAAYVASTA